MRHWVLSLESPKEKKRLFREKKKILQENLSFTLSSPNPDLPVLVSLLKGRFRSLGHLEPRDLGMHECTWEGFPTDLSKSPDLSTSAAAEIVLKSHPSQV